jgi:hypothetical protein
MTDDDVQRAFSHAVKVSHQIHVDNGCRADDAWNEGYHYLLASGLTPGDVHMGSMEKIAKKMRAVCLELGLKSLTWGVITVEMP